MKITCLLKHIVSNLKKPDDERLLAEMTSILSIGMISLIGALVAFAILSETLDIRYNIQMPFSLSTQIMFVCGIVCYACNIALCKKCVITKASGPLIFLGVTFPTSLLAEIPLVVFKGHELFTSTLTIILWPILSIVFYMVLNLIFLKNLTSQEECSETN